MINKHTGEKEILVMDFDGVIHSYTSGWHGAHHAPDPPVAGVREFMLAASEEFQICVISARSSQPGGIDCMHRYIRDIVELPIQQLTELDFPLVKPPAHLWIDDRALCFDGKWPTIESLVNFVPWNNREV